MLVRARLYQSLLVYSSPPVLSRRNSRRTIDWPSEIHAGVVKDAKAISLILLRVIRTTVHGGGQDLPVHAR
ncbi:hypothetical protein LIA77_10659 [Sarocladium implicatum]|nr:hypothetical protein LIA77_10659 [Sarocladium implicatum]